MKTVADTVLSAGFAEFSCRGEAYLIQQESSKGCHCLSLWRVSPKSACLCRVCFDVFDGVSAETVEELLGLPLPEGRTVRDLVRDPACVPGNGNG